MKTDKELLELAAKAAGLNVKMIEVDQDDNFTGLVVGKRGTKERICWNPLKSDGDAFRLAVALDMSLTHFALRVDVRPFYEGVSGCNVSEAVTDGRLAATRRAIVRAAAAIGERLCASAAKC